MTERQHAYGIAPLPGPAAPSASRETTARDLAERLAFAAWLWHTYPALCRTDLLPKGKHRDS